MYREQVALETHNTVAGALLCTFDTDTKVRGCMHMHDCWCRVDKGSTNFIRSAMYKIMNPQVYKLLSSHPVHKQLYLLMPSIIIMVQFFLNWKYVLGL